MIRLLITWRGVDHMLGTYETIERIDINASVEETLVGLRRRGAISAEILSVNVEG
jgi:hypothetical protein